MIFCISRAPDTMKNPKQLVDAFLAEKKPQPNKKQQQKSKTQRQSYIKQERSWTNRANTGFIY